MGRLHTHDPVANFIFTEKKQKSMKQSGFHIEKSLILPWINNLSKNGPLYVYIYVLFLYKAQLFDRMSHYRVKW